MFGRDDNSGLVAVKVELAKDISKKTIKLINDERNEEWESEIKYYMERKIFPLSREKAIEKIKKGCFFYPGHLYSEDMITAKTICKACHLTDHEYIWLNLDDARFIYNMSDELYGHCE